MIGFKYILHVMGYFMPRSKGIKFIKCFCIIATWFFCIWFYWIGLFFQLIYFTYRSYPNKSYHSNFRVVMGQFSKKGYAIFSSSPELDHDQIQFHIMPRIYFCGVLPFCSGGCRQCILSLNERFENILLL